MGDERIDPIIPHRVNVRPSGCRSARYAPTGANRRPQRDATRHQGHDSMQGQPQEAYERSIELDR